MEVDVKLLLSLSCVLIFSLLAYFYIKSRSKVKANKQNGTGLLYLSIAYLLYFIIGIMSYITDMKITDEVSPNSTIIFFYIISSLVNLCFLSSLSFFSLHQGKMDDLVESELWRKGIKFLGYALVILISLHGVIHQEIIPFIDVALNIIAFVLMGYYITRYFLNRGLHYIAFISVMYFGIYISILVFSCIRDKKFGHIKYDDVNDYYLGPAGFLSVILLSYTFNWLNELNFYELSSIWVENKETETSSSTLDSYSNVTKSKDNQAYLDLIGKDKIEEVIEQVIIYKKLKNRNIEEILILAARNTRNNNNQMKGILRNEEYQLNRNIISDNLISLVRAM